MEFKKLSDVEVVETVSDNANVLVEENGIIKKVAKTEVGGGGGYYIVVDRSKGTESDAIISVPDGLYNILKTMITTLVPINIMVYGYENDGSYATFRDDSVYGISYDFYDSAFFIYSNTYIVRAYSDGTVEVSYND